MNNGENFKRSCLLLITVIFVFLIWSDVLTRCPVPQGNILISSIGQQLYDTPHDSLTCVTKHSNNTCSFPVLNHYHKECGYFYEWTSWENLTAGFPRTQLVPQICKLPAVSPSHLVHYISRKNVTYVVVLGDSNGARYYAALVQLFTMAKFHCKLTKKEKTGFNISINYYNTDPHIGFSDTVRRTCSSCNSQLRVCSKSGAQTLSVEYISMMMTSSDRFTTHNFACRRNASVHPLCGNITQQQFVFKYYLNRNVYPQLLLAFSTFAHDREKPLAHAYDGMKYYMSLLHSYTPTTSTVIWYDTAARYSAKYNAWWTREGTGFDPNDKIRMQNRFLFRLLHNKFGERSSMPKIYAFFDLYHMLVRTGKTWASDHVHSKPDWYRYVIAYTASMLYSEELPA